MTKGIKLPKELDIICDDLKLCGRKEFSDLLKVRYQYNVEKGRKAKEEKEANRVDGGEKELTMD